jgi:dTDP-4-dehydrorhamnose reductase
MKVLVTGCYGQVGHCLVEQLSAKSIEILAVDRDHLDITNQDAVMKTVYEFRPDVIINAAAHTAVDKAEQEEELSYLINRDGPKYLAQAASSVDAAILHISTDYVFSGDKEEGGYSETDTTDPQGVYGASKLAGEIAVRENCSRHIILRTAWVFGEHGNNFVKTMLRLGAQRDSIGIVADQFGGPTYAGDIAAALILIAESIVSGNTDFGVYHFSGLPHVSWFDFASKIFDLAVSKNIISKKPELSPLTTDMYPTPAKRPANSKLYTDKIKCTFGIEASDWQKALDNLNQYS